MTQRVPTSTRRRNFITAAAAAAALPLLPAPALAATPTTGPRLTRVIPSTGEAIPVIGMGTWISFNVGGAQRHDRLEVFKTFLAHGGGMVDSSPMYGSAQDVLGWCIDRVGATDGLFSATKVWTRGKADGQEQIRRSTELWRLPRFDLLQVHNLVDWENHLETLFAMKAAGRLRYVGITTSHGRYHRDFARIMERHPLDFVQLTYNIDDREVEDRLLPLAAERGQAVIANRPFQGGRLPRAVRGRHPLPPWAGEIGCANWPQFFLKFAVSHPAVTCAIPATSQVAHMRENMGAGLGPLPDATTRRRMLAYFQDL